MRTEAIIGRKCEIQAGRTEFIGRVGTIVALEGGMFRIKLLVPVNLPAAGEVKDALWKRRDFRLLRQRPGATAKSQ
jgi:hypothetical protein